jgi:crystallin alpha B
VFVLLEVRTSLAMVPQAGFSGPWPALSHQTVGNFTSHYDSDGFQAAIDVTHFDPSDIKVKTVDHTIVVEAIHDDREDSHSIVARSFERKFRLPNEYDMSTIKSTLSKDGILHLFAPKPDSKQEERHVEIHHSEKPSFLMSLLSNRANSMLRRSHSIPSDEEED